MSLIQELLNQFLANPYAHVAMSLGLFMVVAITLSSGVLLVVATFNAVSLYRARRTYKRTAPLLREVMLRNANSNPQIAALAAVLMKTLDPSSELFTGDLDNARRLLNLPDAETLKREAESLVEAAKSS